MTKKTWLPTLSILALLGAMTSGAAAMEPDAPPVEPPASQEEDAPRYSAQATAELAEFLLGKPPATSVQPQTGAAANDGLAAEMGWWYGICWASCWPCYSDYDCPWGETCRFNVQCP